MATLLASVFHKYGNNVGKHIVERTKLILRGPETLTLSGWFDEGLHLFVWITDAIRREQVQYGGRLSPALDAENCLLAPFL